MTAPATRAGCPRCLFERLCLRVERGSCGDDRKRFPLQIGHEGITRNAKLALWQMDDILVDRALGERHKIGIRNLGNRRNQVTGLDDNNSEAGGFQVPPIAKIANPNLMALTE